MDRRNDTFRRDAEEGTKNEGISDAEKLFHVMDAISAKLDSMASRMDRADSRLDVAEESFKKWAKEEGDEPEHKDAKKDGEEEEEKKDAKRKDEEGDKREADSKRKDGEEEEKKEEPVTDKRRKDARKDEEEEKKEEREDSRRKDAKKDEEGEAEMDSMRGAMADMQARLKELQTRVPAMLSDADRERFASIQEQADPAFQAFGDKAPAPLDGETPTSYKRRLATKLQGHSPKWKDSRLSAIADDVVLDTIVGDIYADSIAAATRGTDVPAGRLVSRTTRSQAGHSYIEWFGDPKAMSAPFRGRAQRAGGSVAKH